MLKNKACKDWYHFDAPPRPFHASACVKFVKQDNSGIYKREIVIESLFLLNIRLIKKLVSISRFKST